MKFLIVGCGSVGKRHIKNLIGLGHTELIGCDSDSNILKSVKDEFGIEISDDFDKSVKEVDAVLICTPNHLHTKFAVKSLKKNKHIFIEKPISHKLAGLNVIGKLAKEKKLVVQVGCMLRFHPLLLKIKEALVKKEIGKIYKVIIEFGYSLPVCKPNQDYSKKYCFNKSMGGGVILDSIHEINYAIWLFGKVNNVFCSANKISNMNMDVEDNADLLLKTADNFNINIHMDYLQLARTRKLKIIGGEGIIKGDIDNNKLSIFKNGCWKDYETKFDHNQTYIDEIKEFISCIKNNSNPSVGFEEGIYDLKVALAAKKSAEKNKVILL